MKSLLVLLALVAVALAAPKKGLSRQEMVDFINNQEGGTWKAKLHDRFNKMSTEQFKGLLGAKRRDENPRRHLFKEEPKFTGDINGIPQSFDAREKWANCADVIGIIADQSSCGSCWAVSSASVMSDRVCIGTNGKNKTPVSSIDLVSCCFDCGYGCKGGYPDEAFYTWAANGVVTGSSHKLDQFCRPYPFMECEHHNNKTGYPACPKAIYKTPKCQKSCQSAYTDKTYANDKVFGKSPVYFRLNNAGVQKEIMTNGPMVFTFDVYEDFELYTSGVYKHTTGKHLGGHAVRVIGWGTENGVDYWLVANSWNEDWGDKGYFKIIRGVDNCSFEEDVSAAVFKQ